jgi:hypothetical protein
MTRNDHHDPVTELAESWITPLRRTGHVRMRFATNDECELYRRAGRRAGHILERPVRTVVTGDQVHVMLDDWMDNPLERQLGDSRTRKAIDAALADTSTSSKSPPTIATVTPIHRDRPSSD